MKVINDTKFILLACLTIGLAPFYPEPHLWGKLKWIVGGANGMQFMDWLDVAMHGLPWILLIRIIFKKTLFNKRSLKLIK